MNLQIIDSFVLALNPDGTLERLTDEQWRCRCAMRAEHCEPAPHPPHTFAEACARLWQKRFGEPAPFEG